MMRRKQCLKRLVQTFVSSISELEAGFPLSAAAWYICDLSGPLSTPEPRSLSSSRDSDSESVDGPSSSGAGSSTTKTQISNNQDIGSIHRINKKNVKHQK